MKTKCNGFLYVMIVLMTAFTHTRAQMIVTGGSSLIISAGSAIVATQDVTVHGGGNLNVIGTLTLKKNFLNQNPGTDTIGSGTVEFSGNAGQTISGVNCLRNVVVNTPGGVTLGGETAVSGTMTLMNGRLFPGPYYLRFSENGFISGTPSVNAMIVPTGTGMLRKRWSMANIRPFLFAVGDTTGTPEYSPVMADSLNIIAWYADIGINLVNSKYPDPGITGNYLNRYWCLRAYSAYWSCNLRFTYTPEDVTGEEASLFSARANPLPWVAYGMADTENHALSVRRFSPSEGWSVFIDTTFISGFRSTTPPTTMVLPPIQVHGGESQCFDATQDLTAGGYGKSFVVNTGGQVTLIAGQVISLLQGTRVFPGGYLHGFITTDGAYCSSQPNPLVSSMAIPAGLVQEGSDVHPGQRIRAYPNPFFETLTVELTGSETPGISRIELYNAQGVSIDMYVLQEVRKFLVSGSTLSPGLYFMRVYTGTSVETIKLIRQ